MITLTIIRPYKSIGAHKYLFKEDLSLIIFKKYIKTFTYVNYFLNLTKWQTVFRFVLNDAKLAYFDILYVNKSVLDQIHIFDPKLTQNSILTIAIPMSLIYVKIY